MRSYRAGSASVLPPNNYDPLATSQRVGELDATISQIGSHAAESRIPIDRNPDAVEKPTWAAPSSIRAFRGRQIGQRPLNTEEGFELEKPVTATIGPGQAGAPTGAEDVSDENSHFGYDPLWGKASEMAGVGPINPGNYGSFAPPPTDGQSHEVHAGTNYSDPRHDLGGYPQTRPDYDVAHTSVLSEPNIPAQLNAGVAGLYIRPPEQFLMGRPAKRNAWLFTRPWDKWADDRLTGNRVRPQSPPDVSGSQLDPRVGPHASMPIRNSSDAPDTNDAYPGAYFAPSGMSPTGSTKNTWRLQPTPWDSKLINSGF